MLKRYLFTMLFICISCGNSSEQSTVDYVFTQPNAEEQVEPNPKVTWKGKENQSVQFDDSSVLHLLFAEKAENGQICLYKKRIENQEEIQRFNLATNEALAQVAELSKEVEELNKQIKQVDPLYQKTLRNLQFWNLEQKKQTQKEKITQIEELNKKITVIEEKIVATFPEIYEYEGDLEAINPNSIRAADIEHISNQIATYYPQGFTGENITHSVKVASGIALYFSSFYILGKYQPSLKDFYGVGISAGILLGILAFEYAISKLQKATNSRKEVKAFPLAILSPQPDELSNNAFDAMKNFFNSVESENSISCHPTYERISK